MPNPKPNPNHAKYIEVLRAMGPEARVRKAAELSAMAKELFLQGLRTRFPNASEAEIRRIYLERLEKCHNRNW